MSDDTRLGDVLREWLDVEKPPHVTESIQVWRIGLGECRCLLESLRQILTDEERQRASRTRAGETREQFIVGRAVLRLLLGNSLATAPTELEFTNNTHGKLGLPSATDLHFSVTHSRQMILIALTRFGPVGVDVEALDRTVDVLEVAHTAFSTDELFHLRQIPAVARLLPFFRCWTRKEAVVKADGCGLMVPLTNVCVPMLDANGGDVRLPRHEGCARDIVRVGEIALDGGYIGALAGISRNQRHPRIIGYSLSFAALTRLLSRA